MSKRIFLCMGGLSVVLTAQAQLAVSSPTTTSLYDPVEIDMLPGFSTSTDGFEAVIRMLPSVGGSWTKTLTWTPLAPAAAGRKVI